MEERCAGEDIFTVTPLEADDNDIFIFSIISGGPGQEEKTAFRLWEFPRAGAEPELTGSNEGESVRINDGKITIELSYLRTVFPETWILVLKCAEENGKSITLRIPEYGGLKAPEEYGRLLEAAEILNSGSMKE